MTKYSTSERLELLNRFEHQDRVVWIDSNGKAHRGIVIRTVEGNDGTIRVAVAYGPNYETHAQPTIERVGHPFN